MENSLDKERADYFSKKVTLLNVFLTFMIVLLHAKTPERWGLELTLSYGFIYWTHEMTQIGVPTFFFLSGLLFYRKCVFADIERKLKSRVHSLLIPYLIWNTIFVGIFFLLVHIPATHNLMNMGDVLNSPSEVIYAIVHSRYTVLWFVKDLMIFCAFSAILYLCIEHLWASLGVLCLSIVLAHGNGIGYEHPLLWLPIYLSGAIVGRHFSYGTDGIYRIIMKDAHLKKRIILLGFLLLALVLLCLFSGLYGNGYTFIYRLFAPMLIWIVVDLILSDYLQHRFVRKRWMSCMFFVFCTHHFVLNILQKFVVLSFPPTHVVLNLTFVLSAVFVFVLMVLLASLLSHFTFYRYLSGGRQ